MKKIIFICPYFGKLPVNQMKLWLKSCEYNQNLKWLIITDDTTQFKLPKNVEVMNLEIAQLKSKIQKKFDFDISLENGYKLCDYKPIYGYIFEDLISGYDYWGHCDLSDCIFGDIQKFLLEALKDNPDKVGFLGHLTLYKNSKEVNERFFIKTRCKKELKDIIGTNKNMAFDETFEYSINYIYKENNFSLKRIDDIYFDISTKYHEFKSSKWDNDFKNLGFDKEKYIVEWDKGKLYKIKVEQNKIIRKEIGYVHYQKRKMDYNLDFNKVDHYFIVPNKFIEFKKEPDLVFYKKYLRHKIININYIKIKIKRLKIKIKNFINRRGVS